MERFLIWFNYSSSGMQPGTDSKNFPKVKQGEEQKERQMQQS